MTPARRQIGLPQQRECLLRKCIGLCQHRNTRLHKHLILRELRCLVGDVRIANTRFGRGEILARDLKVRNGSIEPVLDGTVSCSSCGNRADRAVNITQRALGIIRGGDVHGCQADARQVQMVQRGIDRVVRAALETDEDRK